MSIISLVEVEGIIPHIGDKKMLGIDRTTEEFDSVIFICKDFDVVNGGTVSDTSKGESIDLIA